MAKKRAYAEVLASIGEVASRLDAAIEEAPTDRVRAGLVRVRDAFEALPHAIRTDQQLERS